MQLDRFEVRVSIQKVLICLVLVIVPLSILGLYLTSEGDRALDRAVGTHLKTIAQMQGNEISHLLSDRISAVNLIAAEPTVVQAAVAQSQIYKRGGENSISAKAEKIEKSWNSPESAQPVREVLASPLSERLRHYRDLDPRLLRITVTDERGVIIAATNKPARYIMGNDEFWHEVYSGGQGAVNVSNILYDNPKKAYYTEVGVPIPEPGTGQLAGIAIAAVDISPVLAAFQQDSIGDGTRIHLVNGDGTVVSGAHMDVFTRARSDEFGAINDSLGTLQGRQTGYVTADLNGGRRVIGFSDIGLKKTYKNLDWTVVASQAESVAAAPIRQVEHFALLMVVLGMLMITLVAVFYALHRKQRFEDIEDVLGAQQPAHS